MEKERREKISFSKLVDETYIDIRWHEFKKNPWNLNYPVAEIIYKLRYDEYRKIVPNMSIEEFCIVDGLNSLIKYKGDSVYFDIVYSNPFKESVKNFVTYMCNIGIIMGERIDISLEYMMEIYNKYKNIFFIEKHSIFVIEEFLKDMHYLYK